MSLKNIQHDKSRGFAAHYCPICELARTAVIRSVWAQLCVYGVPIGTMKDRNTTATCLTCDFEHVIDFDKLGPIRQDVDLVEADTDAIPAAWQNRPKWPLPSDAERTEAERAHEIEVVIALLYNYRIVRLNRGYPLSAKAAVICVLAGVACMFSATGLITWADSLDAAGRSGMALGMQLLGFAFIVVPLLVAGTLHARRIGKSTSQAYRFATKLLLPLQPTRQEIRGVLRGIDSSAHHLLRPRRIVKALRQAERASLPR